MKPKAKQFRKYTCLIQFLPPDLYELYITLPGIVVVIAPLVRAENRSPPSWC